MPETTSSVSAALIRPAIEEVLAQADAIDAVWAEVIRETGDRPPIKAWEADDDARRDLASAAVAILRNLLGRVDQGLPVLLAAPRPPDPELIVMVCPDAADDDEEYVIEYPAPWGRQYDEAVFLQAAGVPTIEIAEAGRGHFETYHFLCGSCEGVLALPECIEVKWS